ncbi:unnamed protein product, partial [Lota lota]
MFTSSLLYFLRYTSAPSAKDTRQDEPKQEEDTTKCGSELPQPPPEQRFDHGRPKTGDEKSQQPFSPVQHSSSPCDDHKSFKDIFKDMSLSPLSPTPMLEFTDQMKQLVNAGT